MINSDQNSLAAEIFYTGLPAVDPYKAVRLHTDKIRSVYRNGDFRRLLVVSFGKAACTMAKAIEDSLGDIIEKGIVITKCGSPYLFFF